MAIHDDIATIESIANQFEGTRAAQMIKCRYQEMDYVALEGNCVTTLYWIRGLDNVVELARRIEQAGFKHSVKSRADVKKWRLGHSYPISIIIADLGVIQ